MKKMILSLLMMGCALHMYAQSTENTLILLNETGVLDYSIYKKNIPSMRKSWMEATKGVSYNYAAHIAESGRVYRMMYFKGEENLGKYIGMRSAVADKAYAENKAMADENEANHSQATKRSTWYLKTDLTFTDPGFVMEENDFRRVEIITVPFDKISTFEKLVAQTNAADLALGLSYNYIVYRALDGYPTNTYMIIIADKSRLAYYTKLEERNTKRKSDSKLAGLNKQIGNLTTLERMDHLYRVPIK